MTRWIASLAAALALAAPAYPCLHLPATYAGSHVQTQQEGIVFWDAGREELVLKNDFRITPGPGGELPAFLGWVVPVPEVPDAYSVEEIGLFEDMFNAWEEAKPKVPVDSKDGALGEDIRNGIELLAKQRVGEYEIQPIRTKGEEAGPALNAWLQSNGFGEIPAEQMRYYLDRKWVWLAVKVAPAAGEATLAREGGLRPLRISVAAKEPFYPLKFSARQGVFGANLYFVTRKEIAQEDLADAQRKGFGFDDSYGQSIPSLSFALPPSVEKIQEKAAKEGKWKRIEAPHVTRLVAGRLNGPDNPIAGWADDFRIATAENPGARPAEPVSPEAPPPPSPRPAAEPEAPSPVEGPQGSSLDPYFDLPRLDVLEATVIP